MYSSEGGRETPISLMHTVNNMKDETGHAISEEDAILFVATTDPSTHEGLVRPFHQFHFVLLLSSTMRTSAYLNQAQTYLMAYWIWVSKSTALSNDRIEDNSSSSNSLGQLGRFSQTRGCVFPSPFHLSISFRGHSNAHAGS